MNICNWKVIICFVLFGNGAMFICHSQEPVPDWKVKYKTLMERYEPDLILSVEERRRMKVERYYTIKSREAAIDTLDIPERKKRKLLKELYRSPFTDEYDRVLSNLQPEDPLADRPD